MAYRKTASREYIVRRLLLTKLLTGSKKTPLRTICPEQELCHATKLLESCLGVGWQFVLIPQSCAGRQTLQRNRFETKSYINAHVPRFSRIISISRDKLMLPFRLQLIKILEMFRLCLRRRLINC